MLQQGSTETKLESIEAYQIARMMVFPLSSARSRPGTVVGSVYVYSTKRRPDTAVLTRFFDETFLRIRAVRRERFTSHACAWARPLSEARASMSVDWFAETPPAPQASTLPLEEVRGPSRPHGARLQRVSTRMRGQIACARRTYEFRESVARLTARHFRLADGARRRRCSPSSTPSYDGAPGPEKEENREMTAHHKNQLDRRGRCGSLLAA